MINGSRWAEAEGFAARLDEVESPGSCKPRWAVPYSTFQPQNPNGVRDEK